METFRFVASYGPLAFGVQRELSCARAAKFEAVEYLWETLRDVSGGFWTDEYLAISVFDASYGKLFDVRLSITEAREARLSLVPET